MDKKKLKKGKMENKLILVTLLLFLGFCSNCQNTNSIRIHYSFCTETNNASIPICELTHGDSLIKLMKNDTNIKANIIVYTSNIGRNKANKKYSKVIADEIIKWFIFYGKINKNRFTQTLYGEDSPYILKHDTTINDVVFPRGFELSEKNIKKIEDLNIRRELNYINKRTYIVLYK